MRTPQRLENGHGHWKAIAFLVAVVILFAAGQALPLREWMLKFIEWTDDNGAWGAVIYTAIYVVAVVLLVPGWILTVGAGVAFGFGWGLFVSVLGATMGATLTFLIARYVARGAVEKYAGRNKVFHAVNETISRAGWKILIFLRMSPAIPWNVSNYLYGVTKLGVRHYIIGTIIGMMPGHFLLLYLGVAGRISLSGRREFSSQEIIFLAIGFAATLGITVYITIVSRRALRESSAEAE